MVLSLGLRRYLDLQNPFITKALNGFDLTNTVDDLSSKRRISEREKIRAVFRTQGSVVRSENATDVLRLIIYSVVS